MGLQIDYNGVVNNLIFFLAGGAIVWIVKNSLKHTKDINANFRKLKKLYKHVHKAEWESHWED